MLRILPLSIWVQCIFSRSCLAHDLKFRLIARQDIPYIRTMRNIPQEMGEKLPPEFVARLEINVSDSNSFALF